MADGNAVDDKFDGVNSGLDAVDIDIQRAIKLPIGSGNQTLIQSPAGRADKAVGFDLAGNLTLHPNAGTSATNASASAASAATSATQAALSATGASASATLANTSAGNTATDASSSSASAASADASQTNAATSETNAATSAASAATSETNAAASAASAATSETNAAGAVVSSTASATAATNSATSATSSALTASTAATNAASSETNAATSAASINPTTLLARANHTGTQLLATISDAGTAAALNVPVTGDALVGEVVLGSDSRLSGSNAASQADVDRNAQNIALNSFRIAINGALSLQTMVDGFVDEYVDETGIEPFNGDPIPTSLMHFDGIAGSSAIVEIGGHAWVSTNAVIDTSLSVFGGSSLAIAQGSNSYLSLPSHVDYIFNNNIDFTIEMRIYPKTPTAGTGSASYGNGYLLTNTTSSLNQQMSFAVYPGGGGSFLIVDTITSVVAIVSFPANSIPFNAWSHLALVRSAGTISIYVNGTAISLTSSTGSNTLPATGFTLNIGKTGGNVANGGIYANIDEFRVLKGIAAYTANFIPSVNPFPDGTTPGTASNNQVYDAVTDSYDNKYLAPTETRLPSVGATDTTGVFTAVANTTSPLVYVNGGGSTVTVQYPQAHAIAYMYIATLPGWGVGSSTLQGSNDGVTWTAISTFPSNAYYTHFKVHVGYAGTQTGQVTYVKLAEKIVTINDLTLQSITKPALTQPTTGNVILLEEDVDAVTLNTDLMAAVSRDGGTTWSNAPLVDKGTFTAGKRILTASADLSTQPAGQSMAYKVTTANGKNLKLHGASLGWK